MRLYLYCVGDELDEAGLAGVCGLGGERARLFRREGLAAVVSPFEEAPVPVTREHLLAHNRVNAQALARTTPLPFRFGTLAGAEELSAYLGERAGALRAALASVRGCVEMSVKMMWANPPAPRPEEPAPSGGAGAGGGTAFLLAKRRELAGDEEARRKADELAAWLEEGAAGLARETRARVRPSEQIVARAAHLVPRERVAEYRERLRTLRAARPDVRFLTSGPWPPYSFTAGATAEG